MSSAITRRSRRLSGTSPSTIRCASPSTIAVLPTPGSPISTGLFLVRRERTWITRRISSSRPITGSSLPASASAVRSRPNFSSAWALSSGLGEVTLCGPRTSATAFSSESRSGSRSATPEPSSVSASSRCSVGDVLVAELRHLLLGPAQRPRQGRGHARLLGAVAASFGSAATASSAARRDRRRVGAELLQDRDRPARRPARAGRPAGGPGRSPGCAAPRPAACAAATASWDLTVNRSACISSAPPFIRRSSSSARCRIRSSFGPQLLHPLFQRQHRFDPGQVQPSRRSSAGSAAAARRRAGSRGGCSSASASARSAPAPRTSAASAGASRPARRRPRS